MGWGRGSPGRGRLASLGGARLGLPHQPDGGVQPIGRVPSRIRRREESPSVYPLPKVVAFFSGIVTFSYSFFGLGGLRDVLFPSVEQSSSRSRGNLCPQRPDSLPVQPASPVPTRVGVAGGRSPERVGHEGSPLPNARVRDKNPGHTVYRPPPPEQVPWGHWDPSQPEQGLHPRAKWTATRCAPSTRALHP